MRFPGKVLLLLWLSFVTPVPLLAQDTKPSDVGGQAPPATVKGPDSGKNGGTGSNAAKSPPVAIKQQLQSNSYRNFHHDLWHNFGGLFARDNALPAAIGFGATAAVSPMDDDIARYFLRRERFAPAAKAGGALGNTLFLLAGEGALFVIGQTRDEPKLREISYNIGQALVMESIILYPLKIVTDRERPNREDSYSFPSGHATSAFAVAAILDHYYGPKVAIPVYATGAFVAFARIEQNKHYLSDVVAGATIGWLIGKTVTRHADEKPRVIPTVSPQVGGVAFGVSIDLSER